VQLFVETCTAMTPSPENVGLVRSAASLFHDVLNGRDIGPLRAFVRRVDTTRTDTDVEDVIAAAGQSVIDETQPSAMSDLRGLVHRVAEIERAALAAVTRPLGCMRPALAG